MNTGSYQVLKLVITVFMNFCYFVSPKKSYLFCNVACRKNYMTSRYFCSCRPQDFLFSRYVFRSLQNRDLRVLSRDTVKPLHKMPKDCLFQVEERTVARK